MLPIKLSFHSSLHRKLNAKHAVHYWYLCWHMCVSLTSSVCYMWIAGLHSWGLKLWVTSPYDLELNLDGTKTAVLLDGFHTHDLMHWGTLYYRTSSSSMLPSRLSLDSHTFVISLLAAHFWTFSQKKTFMSVRAPLAGLWGHLSRPQAPTSCPSGSGNCMYKQRTLFWSHLRSERYLPGALQQWRWVKTKHLI